MTTRFYIDDLHVLTADFRQDEISMIDEQPGLTALGAVRELALQNTGIAADAKTVVIVTPAAEHVVPVEQLKQLLDDYLAEVGKAPNGMTRNSELNPGHCIVLGPFPKWLQPDDISVFRRTYPAIFRPERVAAAQFDTPDGGPQ